MRIVHIITCLLRAGSEENTIATCNAQAARGHEVWLVYGREVDPATLAMVGEGVATVHISSLLREVRPRKDLAALRDLTRIIRKIVPDVVHTHASKAGFVGRLAARRAGVPIILHGVHILPFLNVSRPKRLLYLSIEKLVAPFTDAFIAVSQGMRDANLAAGLGSVETNHVVYSGMDLIRFRTATPTDCSPEGRMIAMVAALEPRKRHSEFLDVFADLVARHQDLCLCLFGQGECEQMLREKAIALGLSEKVHFLGFRSDIERWMAAAEICVLPSMREGLPRVVVQYAAVGRPVVVTRLPGIEEIVEDGHNGFVVEAVEDMALPLDRLLRDSALAERMAAAAQHRDLSQWSLDRMEPDIERIMVEIGVRKGLITWHGDGATRRAYPSQREVE